MRNGRDRTLVDEASEVLNTFIQGEDQSFEQFTSLFDHLSVNGPAPETSESNIDGILSYLENRENDVISGRTEANDSGTFSIINQSIPQSETIHQLDTFSNGGVQCLDVMLNHLQARETSLERSPEYSIEINISDSIRDNSVSLQPAMDNRYLSDSSENCSSEIPDNDRRALAQNTLSSLIPAHSSYSDDIEVIELGVSEPLHTSGSNSISDSLSEFMKQPVSLKVDNFVSSDYCYDSDKDIDESEQQPEDEFDQMDPYIPSFHSNECSIPNGIPEYPENSIDNQLNSSESNSSLFSYNDQPLPGEIVDSNIQEHPRVHLRMNDSNNELLNNAEVQWHTNFELRDTEAQEGRDDYDNDTVESFFLDTSFNYNNVQTTNRLDHYNL